MLLFVDLFLFLHNLTRLLQRIENICYLFYWWDFLLFFCIFLSNQENLYMINHDVNLILNYLSASSLIMISVLSLFECITCSSSLSSSDETKLIVTVNWILHLPDFLRLFMIPFKYGLILFFRLCFCIQYNHYSKNYLLLLVYNNFLLLFHTRKDS